MRTILACLYSLCLTCNFSLFAEYVRPSYVNEEEWNTLAPYFLPETFPEKEILDETFKKWHVLKSLRSLKKSGFFILTNPKDKIIVAQHIRIKRFLLKIYLDGSLGQEWKCWLRRVKGAKLIQQGIDDHGYRGIMKVPQKWVYPLPYSETADANSKHFVLVVEKIDILNDERNRRAYWKKMTPYLLNALYTMLKDYLLIDSVYADNTPFCKDGKLAFIDTEYTAGTTRPVPYRVVGHYLSPEMKAYWHWLINQ